MKLGYIAINQSSGAGNRPKGGKMALSLTKTQLIELLPQCITITSEVGRVSGPGYRERYLTPGGYYLDVAYYAGDIVAWAIRRRRCQNWQVEA